MHFKKVCITTTMDGVYEFDKKNCIFILYKSPIRSRIRSGFLHMKLLLKMHAMFYMPLYACKFVHAV